MDRSKPIDKLPTVAIAAICVGYLAVRLWGSTDSCLWFDEIFSVHAAEHSWNTILSFVSLDLIHPPLFYVLLKLWIAIGGEGLFWLRLFPVVFAIGAIFPFLALCRELKLGKWTQVLALFLFAVNGSLIKYAQEVRMYSPLLCLSLFSTWLFARYFVKGKSFAPLVIVNVLMVYTHYFGWFVVLTEVVLILWFQRIKWRPIVLMFGITLVGFLPWLIAVLQAAGSGSGLSQNIGWMARPGIRQVVTFVLNILEPFYFQTSSAEPISIFRITVPLLLIIAIAAFIYTANWKKLGEYERRHAYFLLFFIKLPVVVTFIASWLLPYSMWGTRHLIVVFAPFCIYAAMILTSGIVKWLPAAAVSLVVMFAGYGLVIRADKASPQNSWCAWEGLATSSVAYESQPIFATEDLIAYHIWFAGRKDENQAPIWKLNGIDGIVEDRAYFLPRGEEVVGIMDLAELNYPKFWLAYRAKTFSESEPPIRNLSAAGYHVVERKTILAAGEDAIMVLFEK